MQDPKVKHGLANDKPLGAKAFDPQDPTTKRPCQASQVRVIKYTTPDADIELLRHLDETEGQSRCRFSSRFGNQCQISSIHPDSADILLWLHPQNRYHCGYRRPDEHRCPSILVLAMDFLDDTVFRSVIVLPKNRGFDKARLFFLACLIFFLCLLARAPKQELSTEEKRRRQGM